MDTAAHGLKLTGKSKRRLQPLITQMEKAKGSYRLLLLLECLQLMAEEKEYTKVSTQLIEELNTKDLERINRVFQFTIDSFRDNICIPQVAAVAFLSVPAFCHYFKRRTQKTYIEFLNEVRVGYACTQLLETDNSVIDICYESGYNTMAHFHRQFITIKGLSPLQYRKSFAPEVINRGLNLGI